MAQSFDFRQITRIQKPEINFDLFDLLCLCEKQIFCENDFLLKIIDYEHKSRNSSFVCHEFQKWSVTWWVDSCYGLWRMQTCIAESTKG